MLGSQTLGSYTVSSASVIIDAVAFGGVWANGTGVYSIIYIPGISGGAWANGSGGNSIIYIPGISGGVWVTGLASYGIDVTLVWRQIDLGLVWLPDNPASVWSSVRPSIPFGGRWLVEDRPSVWVVIEDPSAF